MIAEWKTFLVSHAEEWGVPASGQWEALFYNNYHPHVMNIDLLWFHDGAPFPRVVTKLCYEPEIPRREFENLRRVYAHAGGFVPRPLEFGQHGQFWGLWMTGVPGFRFQPSEHISPKIVRSMATMVMDMHRTLMMGVVGSQAERYRRMVTEPLRAVAEFGTSAVTWDGCRRLKSQVTEEWLSAQPVIPQHGDLYAGNLISHRGQWYAVDWESYGTIDLPFYDLFTLFFSILCANDEVPMKWNTALAREMSECALMYCAGVGLAKSAISSLLPLALVNWFFLQWSDGRREFAARMYKIITEYFEHTALWAEVFQY